MPVFSCDPSTGLGNQPGFYGQKANPSCFGVPSFTGSSIAINGLRNMPYLSGPSYFDSDLALYKTFHVTERQSVQFRASAFNWLNHPLPQFSGGGQLQLNNFLVDYQTKVATLNLSNHNWGYLDQKTGAPNQRIFELSVKYSF